MTSQSLGALLGEAATLMITGMLFVYAFLALLIAGIKGIAWYCNKFPGESPATKRPVKQVKSMAGETVDSATLAAITAAIHQHRNKPE